MPAEHREEMHRARRNDRNAQAMCYWTLAQPLASYYLVTYPGASVSA